MQRSHFAIALLSTLLWVVPAGAEDGLPDAATSVTVESAGDGGDAPQRTVSVESASPAELAASEAEQGTSRVARLGLLAVTVFAAGAAILSRRRGRVAHDVAR